MRRLIPISLMAACALAGCGPRKISQSPAAAKLPSVAKSFSDPSGDAVDESGATRRARPDVDIASVVLSRNSNGVRIRVLTAAKPKTTLTYELFAQTDVVAGYDVVTVSRPVKGSATGYVAFENSAARQTLQPGAITVKDKTLTVTVPLDPILGATPFQWRETVSTAVGPKISDYLPSSDGLKNFP